MSDDAALLRDYATTGSERAFTELVERHVDLVYFAALRRCGGDTHRAEDVTQQVFSALAGNAPRLAGHTVLAGWLYVTTRNVAAKLRRAEHTHRRLEAEALAMNETLSPDLASKIDWERIRPVLDGALDELGEHDRDAVLLRFFEGRAFAEIGATLRLTEDAARMRVDRALDKLRRMLARRGITSTSAALALALSHAAEIKPPGLVASVASTALAASSVAVSAGLGASGAAASLMMAKLGVGTTVAIATLCASIAGNVWLSSKARQHGHIETRSASVVAGSPLAAIPAPVTFADLAATDLYATRDKMRAAGASEATIRGVLEGVLRRRYREKLSTLRAERLATGWWRERDFTRIISGPVRTTPAEDPRLFREMVRDPLEQLLGPDPADVAEENAKYGFLPESARRDFAQLEADFAFLQSQDVVARYAGRQTAYEQERTGLEAKRQQLIAGLSAEQRNEYDLRYGPVASVVAQRMALIDGTEAEYRAVYQLVDARVKEKSPTTTRDAQSFARSNLDQAAADQLVGALGFERARDYIWSGASDFPAYARVTRGANLPLSAATRAFQLAAETIETASRIHFDPALTLDQKRAAMDALHDQAQREFDRVLPREVQQELVPQSLAWLTELKAGRYKPIPTSLGGSAGIIIGGWSIDKPVSGPWHAIQVLPRRPAGG